MLKEEKHTQHGHGAMHLSHKSAVVNQGHLLKGIIG